ncbi:MAG: large-conductance mechanosensitive channel protein MscL [Kiritimatiellaeota bacterium]|nr:large-conductance mechanosensitive channel protein MscL [Kiritimatiellota bacterium]
MVKEFKEFAMKGNVIDMAVGIIIGGAFGKIVSSLVADIIMPPLGWVLGGMDFQDLQWTLQAAVPLVEATETTPEIAAIPEIAIRYGLFIKTVIDFLIIALSIFVALKSMKKVGTFIRKDKADPAT